MAYEKARSEFATNGARMIKECQAAEATTRAAGDPQADYHCERLEPQRDAFVDLNGAHRSDLFDLLLWCTFVGGAVSFLLSAASAGRDLNSGVVSLELTFEPRRWRLFISRLAASAGTSMVVGLLSIGTRLLAGLAAIRLLAATATDAQGEIMPALAAGARSIGVIVGVGLLGSR